METVLIVVGIFLVIISTIVDIITRLFNNYIQILNQIQKPLGKPINEYYCTVGINVVFNAEFEGLITDFSKYESNNLIVFTDYETQSPPEDYEDCWEEINTLILIPNCIVHEYEGGFFDWQEL